VSRWIKGLVDAFFSNVSRWIKNAVKVPKALIKALEQLVDICTCGAQHDEQNDPPIDGPASKVLHIKSGRQPAKSYRLTMPKEAWQMQKTYCPQCRPHASGYSRWWNHTFSDRTIEEGPSAAGVACKEYSIPVRDRDWRRGHYTKKQWGKEPLKRGSTSRTNSMRCASRA